MNATALTLSVDSVDDAVAPYVHQRALRPMGATDLRVRLAFVGICGTDVEILHGRMPATFEINYPHSLGHEWSGVVEDVGADVKRFQPGADEAAADRAWSGLGLGRGPASPVVCLNTGGAFGPAKNWPVEHFAAWRVGSPTRRGSPSWSSAGRANGWPPGRSRPRAGHPEVVSLADQPLSLGLTKACIRRSALLITTDSGPRHFAAPFGCRADPLRADAHRLDPDLSSPGPPPLPPGPVRTLPATVCPEGHHRCMPS